MTQHFLATAFVVHRNRPVLCASLVMQFLSERIDVKVRVIDNASTPASLQELTSRLPNDPRVQVIRNSNNMGFAGALEGGIRSWLQDSTSPFCITAAHDTYTSEHTLEKLISVLCKQPEYGASFPLTEERATGIWSPIRGVRHLPLAVDQESESLAGLFFPSPLMVLGRELLSKALTPDPALFAYCEECDVGLTARRLGLGACCVPSALARNVENGDSSGSRYTIQFLLARNSVLLAKKFAGSAASRARVCWLVASAVAARIGLRGPAARGVWLATLKGALSGLKGLYGSPK